ncbi:hypothetical protein [Virgibacillus dokdonensis]
MNHANSTNNGENLFYAYLDEPLLVLVLFHSAFGNQMKKAL